MTSAALRRLTVCFLSALAAVVFFTGIGWGLPSRDADRYLFGDQPAWSGDQVMALAGQRKDDVSMGVDVSRHRLEHRERILTLNATDIDRAEIIRRYRLYSCQPDENLTLMSLSRMHPGAGDLDPKFYQYGGVWVYSVGAAVKAASVFHLLQVTPNVAFYIDHPESFGRFYIAARSVAALWGVLGIWPIFRIARRLSGDLWISAASCLAYMLMPVVINMAHEAKPHLPGAVLMLYAVVAGCKYVESGLRKQLILTGMLCGAAFGTVLSAALIFVIIPVMALLRHRGWGARLKTIVLCGAIGLLTYFVTNPYVAINLVRNRAVLRSNLTNSTNMYQVGGFANGTLNALRLIGEGASPGLAIGGAIAIAISLASSRKLIFADAGRGGRSTLSILLAAPSALIFAQFISLAAGKPGEYGRFAMFLDIALMLAAIAGINRLIRSRLVGSIIIVVLLFATAIPGLNYVAGFIRDSRPHNSRLIVADWLERIAGGEMTTVAVWAEPAPYAVPPMNLFKTQLLLLPMNYEPSPGHPPADVLIRAEDSVASEPPAWSKDYDRFVIQGRPAQISWANKPFVIYARRIGQ